MSDAVEVAVGLLSQVTKLLRGLNPEQLEQLSEGTAKIAFVPPGYRIGPPTAARAEATTDIGKLAAEVQAMGSAGEVIRRLRNVTVPNIDRLAAFLKISLPRANKEPKIKAFAQSLVGHRESDAVVMGDAYRR